MKNLDKYRISFDLLVDDDADLRAAMISDLIEQIESYFTVELVDYNVEKIEGD